MKEFEKWRGKQDIGYARKSCCTNAIAVGMEQGWRAALEWAYSRLVNRSDGASWKAGEYIIQELEED